MFEVLKKAVGFGGQKYATTITTVTLLITTAMKCA